MVKTFALEEIKRTASGTSRDEKELHKQIRDRCFECYVPRCWILKDPNDDGQINLKGRYVKGGKRERVQLRRLLFLMEYKQLPIGRVITMRCGDKRCINPAHMQVKGFDPSFKKAVNMVEREILTWAQAYEWYAKEEE